MAEVGRATQILVVEDNDDLRTVLSEVLADAGYDVVAAGDGANALAIGRTTRPDAIVLDLMMPGMDGSAFLRERQAVPALAQAPVLVLTAHPFPFRMLDGMSPTAILKKPYDLDDLLAAVESLCAGETGRGCVS